MDSPRTFKAPYRPGEVVFIGEDFSVIAHGREYGGRIRYESDQAVRVFDEMPDLSCHWRPVRDWLKYRAVTMPEWASRFKVRVSVTAKRVREITEDEAKLMGFDCSWLIYQDGNKPHNTRRDEIYRNGNPCGDTMLANEKDEFRYDWNSRHPGSCALNQWVWRYELEKV